jgi:hypothetical protein
VDGDARDDERHPRHLDPRRDLGEHGDADHCGGRGQQGDHQRVGGTRQPAHRQLVRDVGDHRGAESDADARQQRHRVGERGQGLPAADRRHYHGRDQHRGGQAVDAAERAVSGHAVREHDVRGEQQRVRERQSHTERLAL